MTLIEFFEKDAIENVCSALFKAPERLILVGYEKKHLIRQVRHFRRFFEARGAATEFSYMVVNKTRIRSVLNAFSKIVETNDECVFDLTGGEDLYLVAIGMLAEKYRDRNLQLHWISVKDGRVFDCDGDGKTIAEGPAPELSVRDIIDIYGGKVTLSTKIPQEYLAEDGGFTPAFEADVSGLFRISLSDPRGWNAHLNDVCKCLADRSGEAKITLDRGRLRAERKRRGLPERGVSEDPVFRALLEQGFIRTFSEDENAYKITFKNALIRKCFTSVGLVLELATYLAASTVTEENGGKTYHDVMTGVHIDWDGLVVPEKNRVDTENEIDVLPVHGMVPVFVSCKNGAVEMEELYKLNTVTERFGGKYARAALVVTQPGRNAAWMFLKQRAEELGIRLIELRADSGAGTNPVDQLKAAVRDLWR